MLLYLFLRFSTKAISSILSFYPIKNFLKILYDKFYGFAVSSHYAMNCTKKVSLNSFVSLLQHELKNDSTRQKLDMKPEVIIILVLKISANSSLFFFFTLLPVSFCYVCLIDVKNYIKFLNFPESHTTEYAAYHFIH